MMKLFDIVPGWLWAAVVAGLIASNLIAGVRLSSERLAHQTTKAAYAEQVAAAQKARADEEAQRRQTETDLLNAQAAHAQEVAALSVQRDNARAVGRVAADRLRDPGDLLLARLGHRLATGRLLLAGPQSEDAAGQGGQGADGLAPSV